MFQDLVATYVSCPLSFPRAISVFVQRECFFYLPVHVVVSMVVEMGSGQGVTFCGGPEKNVASVFGSIIFTLTTYFGNKFCYQKTSISFFLMLKYTYYKIYYFNYL